MDTNGNQMKEFIRIKKGEYDLGLVFYTYVEEETKVAYTPALELSGIGTTEQEAVQDLLQIIQITFDYALTKGTVDEMLFDLGWKKVSEKMIEAPVFSDEEVRHKIKVPHFQKHKELMAIPA